ncbi:DNA-directed RNA polymerase sigma-70 factor [Bacteroidia bacterium]|nr:DNA-directed RNA polymerase sigma-70 factor [Bacteroidia bacterium]GHU14554.1 DNA-directed RNA polymerase sigma-70 factor [Betaproteobacteria bacterium]
MLDEHNLLIGLKQGNEEAFSLLFKAYYKDLVLFGGWYLPDRVACEDIVQSIFLKLWDERSALTITSSLKSYLLKSVRNACLDEIRHQNIIQEHEDYTAHSMIYREVDIDHYILYSDLQKYVEKVLKIMPEAYREAFLLSRNEGLKYREIAEKLQVSERTVEVRMSKALELLRKYLKEFLV